jgi:hypothetical protein
VAEESPQVIATSTEDKPQTKPEELTNHKVPFSFFSVKINNNKNKQTNRTVEQSSWIV